MRHLVELTETDSTNNWLKLGGQPVWPFLSVRAQRQTAGRGRAERSWFSGDSDQNLAFSILLPYTPRSESLVPLRVALCLHRALSRYAAVQIKWPNDICLAGKKLAGVLCETHPQADGLAIAGVGINVLATDFPPELAQSATSLRLEAASVPGVRSLWCSLTRSLRREFSVPVSKLSAEFIREYNNASQRYVRRPEIEATPLEFETLLQDGRAQFRASAGTVLLDQPL